MSNSTVALWSAIGFAVLLACLVTITFRTAIGKTLGYLACVLVAVAPLFGRYAVLVLAVAALVLALAVAVGRRLLSRRP